MISAQQRAKTRKQLDRCWRDPLKPPDELPVDVWAERHYVVTHGECRGSLHLDRTPYLREIVNTLNDPNVERVTLCFGSQSGKTTALLIILAYAICEKPTEILFAISTEKLAKDVALDRLDPLIDATEPLRSLQRTGRFDNVCLKKRFRTCNVTLIGAQSERDAKSRPVGLVFCDEVDDFRGTLELIRNRTKGHTTRKIYQSGTPTDEYGNVWTEFLKGSQEYFHVPCPHCSTMQKLVAQQPDKSFSLVIPPECKNGDDWDTEAVRDLAHYKCVKCGGTVEDKHKPDMLRRGEWRADNPGVRSHRSFHLNSLYAPTVTFGDYAKEFIETKRYVDRLRKFRMEWQAEPWTIDQRQQSQSTLAKKQGEYAPGSCPVEPLEIFLTADVGKERCWYVVRAWSGGGTSYLMEYGSVPNLRDLQAIKQRGCGGRPITMAFVDHGWQGNEISKFCVESGFIPVKSEGIHGLTKWGKTQEGLDLLTFHDHGLKLELLNKINAELGLVGSWYLYQETPAASLAEYYFQMSAEQLVKGKDNQGFEKLRFEKIHDENHLLDCEKYNLGAAIARQIFYTSADAVPQPARPRPETNNSQQEEMSFRRPDGRDFWSVTRT